MSTGELVTLVVVLVGVPFAAWLGIRMLRSPGDGPGGKSQDG